MNVAAAPGQGQVVRVRTRRYLVESVTPPPDPAEQTLVHLSCLDDDAQGTPLSVLWEREVDAEILGAANWDQVAKQGFDKPEIFSAFYHALRWNCVTATDPRLFQAPHRAGIQVQAFQLEPLRKALHLPRVNLFIADDVGLGKTIEAGLIVRELLMRQKVRQIVVACPASVVLQWRDEMESRFGLTFQVFDREFVIKQRRERGYGINPWTTHTRFIISHSLLRDEAYAGPLRDTLGDFAPGSLLILDEAHNAAPASSAKYAIDSQLTRVVREVADRFEHRLFLSATPHNGHSNSFSALLEILDPQRFCRGVPVVGAKILEDVMVRRLKRDLREVQGGFPDREVKQIDISDLPSDAPELRLAQLLAEYAESRNERLKSASKRAQAAAGLVVTSLQKRLLSSIEAFACTLRVHRKAFERQYAEALSAAPGGVQIPRPAPVGNLTLLAEAPGGDDDRAELSEAEVEAEEVAQMEAASAATPLGDLERQLNVLRSILQKSEDALGFSKSHFRNALSASLAVLGAPPLKRVEGADGLERWQFADLGDRSDWSETLDTLRAPRRRDQKPWDWRREAPIRPLLLEDSGTLDDDLVHMHLEHRVAQRLLGRFLSQGFVHHDLSRAVMGTSRDAIPRVILLGRLSLYGDGASRLHDEILAVAARWIEPDIRQGALKAFADQAEARALENLERALEDARPGTVPEEVAKNLLRSVPLDVRDLLEPMELRAKELAAQAVGKLAERGTKEAEAMQGIIMSQRDRIQAQLSKKGTTLQIQFQDYSVDERRQLEQDIKHWEKRLARMELDLQTEPARIQKGYEVRAQRIEPVGIAYLWPVTG